MASVELCFKVQPAQFDKMYDCICYMIQRNPEKELLVFQLKWAAFLKVFGTRI